MNPLRPSSEVYEKAMPFFDLASKIQPGEVKWQLMVASCYRRIGAYNEALAKVGRCSCSFTGAYEDPRTDPAGVSTLEPQI